MKILFIAYVAFIISSCSNSSDKPPSGIIDFESIPGTSPSEGLPISNQFAASHGVTFSLANNQPPILAEVGLPQTAFQGFNQGADRPSPESGVGNFFLTNDGVVAGPPSPLIVSYATPVAAAKGVMIDIDSTESWNIEAFDSNGGVMDNMNLTAITTDGGTSAWSFDFSTPIISEIRLPTTPHITEITCASVATIFHSLGCIDVFLSIAATGRVDDWRGDRLMLQEYRFHSNSEHHFLSLSKQLLFLRYQS